MRNIGDSVIKSNINLNPTKRARREIADIFEAIHKHDVNAVRDILSNDINVIYNIDQEGNTPLHKAAEIGSNIFDIIKILVEHGSNLNEYNYYGSLPFDVAEEPEIQSYLKNNNPRHPKTTKMHIAFHDKNFEKIMQYIDNNYELNTPDLDGFTPLHLAIMLSDSEITEKLINKGALLNVRDRAGNAPIHYNYNETIQEILERHKALLPDAYPPAIDLLNTSLHKAAENGNLAAIRKILEKKPFLLNSTNRKLETPLYNAILSRNAESVLELIQQGADLKVTNFKMQTPLEYALFFMEYKTVIQLVKHGAPVNANLFTLPNRPLHIAVEENQLDLVKTLIEYGADINDVSDSGNTPLHIAVDNSKNNKTSEKIAHFLLENGAQPDLVTDDHLNIVDLAKSSVNGQLKHNIFSKELKKFVEINKKHLEHLSAHFAKIIRSEQEKARNLNKKFLVLLGELHGYFDIYQVEKRMLSILKQAGIKNLYTEKDTSEASFPIEYIAQKDGMTITGIDDHPERETANLKERNIIISNHIHKKNADAVFITGCHHLYGLLADEHTKIDPQRFYTLAFNLASIRDHIDFPDLESTFSKDPTEVVQTTLSDEYFSPINSLKKNR